MHKKWAFFLIISLFFPSAFAKYQVCSITINSSDELEIFKQNLSSDHFEFVELLPSNKEGYEKHDSHWFNEACKENYKCDILIVSGHFGGTFFGKSEFTLPTELMEQKACQNLCQGVLSNVKEIFLFGCNTLANKTKDRRTYQEYLQVLLDDGMARETAERVVASRYSPLESPFYERMNFIFKGSKTVYGFDQLSPLGEHIRGSLSEYFKSINAAYGNYHTYFSKKTYDRKKNTELLTALSHTTINQVHLPSVVTDNQKEQLFQNKCTLLNDKDSFSNKTKALRSIFINGNSGSAFFTIDYFLSKHQKEMVDTEQGRQTFRYIKNNKTFSEQFKDFYQHLTHLPYIKIMYLNILNKFQWIDSVEFQSRLKNDILGVIKESDREAYISVLLLLENEQIKKRRLYFSEQDLPKGYVKNLWSLLILEKLQVQAPHLQFEVLKFCDDSRTEKAKCYQALNTLAHISPQPKWAKKVMLLLNTDDRGLIAYGLRALGQMETDRYNIHSKVASYLNHEDSWVRSEAIDALIFLESQHGDIQEKLSEMLFVVPKKTSIRILKSLSILDIQNLETSNNIFKYTLDNIEDKEIFVHGILSMKSSPKLPTSVINYFYKILDIASFKDPYFKFILQTIPEMKTQDIGIFYRLSQFHKVGDADFKVSVLDHISLLEWFHPEIQPEMLKYLMDRNREVRESALTLMKNFKNLNKRKLLNSIKELDNQNEEIEALQSYLMNL